MRVTNRNLSGLHRMVEVLGQSESLKTIAIHSMIISESETSASTLNDITLRLGKIPNLSVLIFHSIELSARAVRIVYDRVKSIAKLNELVIDDCGENFSSLGPLLKSLSRIRGFRRLHLMYMYYLPHGYLCNTVRGLNVTEFKSVMYNIYQSDGCTFEMYI